MCVDTGIFRAQVQRHPDTIVGQSCAGTCRASPVAPFLGRLWAPKLKSADQSIGRGGTGWQQLLASRRHKSSAETRSGFGFVASI